MRYLLLSDIHANRVALEAVLRHAARKRYDRTLFLGDAVGYYTQPDAVLTLIRGLEPDIAIMGNHEMLLLQKLLGEDTTDYKEDGVVSEVIEDHKARLSDENLAFIKGLRYRERRDGWEVAHGGLRHQWEYLNNLQQAQDNLPFMETNLCFVGHTHVPKVFACVPSPTGDLWRTVAFRSEQAVYRVPPKAKLIFNPGSVGQPRDGIPLASYTIFDEDHRVLEHYRVEYDVLAVQREVREHGYPEALAGRLTVGR